MSRFRRQGGQATVMTVLFLVSLVGMMGAVLDVGAWFRADRKLQANSDAAALAGAQALPDDTGGAMSLALDYAGRNGGDVDSGDVSFETTVIPNDTILIEAEKDASGVFTGIFGIDSVEVHARAKARTGTLTQAKYVAPVVVNWKHPMLSCTPAPCTNPTQIELIDLHKPGSGNAAGSFGLINLEKGSTGNAGADRLAGWMERGYDEYMDLGFYQSVPSSEFNNTQFRDALTFRLGTEVLFPIYKTLVGSGSQAKYDVIGWVGFVPTSFKVQGSSGTVNGSFKRVIWHGIPATSPNQPAFGAYGVQLIE